MQFTPLTEQELRAQKLVEPGRYKFTVLFTQQKTSGKSGNEYFNLKLRINVGGREQIIYDLLMFEGKLMYKLRHFCYGSNLADKYDAGNITPLDCDGREGELELVHTQNKQTGEMQNFVKDYIVPEKEVANEKPFNDDIPF